MIISRGSTGKRSFIGGRFKGFGGKGKGVCQEGMGQGAWSMESRF
jgi:hypothetical protein